MTAAPLDFSALPLNEATLANLAQLGYHQMTPIQAASLPPALAGKDLIAQAQTGSGKTAAFALALVVAWVLGVAWVVLWVVGAREGGREGE